MSVIDRHGSVLYVWQHEVGGPELDQVAAERDRALHGVVADLMDLCPEPPVDPEPIAVALWAVITDVPFVLSSQLAILPRSDAADFVAQLSAWGSARAGAIRDRPAGDGRHRRPLGWLPRW